MSRKNIFAIDPVCGMQVDLDNIDPEQNVVEYQQMQFVFCSVQCKERFLANPYAYIGYPGHKAPAPLQRRILKRRHIRLEQPVSRELAEQLQESVDAMMGIEKINIEGDCIEITYDLLQATEAQIEAELTRVGAALEQGWREQLRRAWVHYTEETEVDNLEERPGPHAHHH